MKPYVEITTANTSNNEIDLKNIAMFSDYGGDTIFTGFMKIFSGTFKIAVGESATGSTKSWTSSETVPPITCSKDNPFNYVSAASGASAAIVFCP
jgi:hypothetical protein